MECGGEVRSVRGQVRMGNLGEARAEYAVEDARIEQRRPTSARGARHVVLLELGNQSIPIAAVARVHDMRRSFASNRVTAGTSIYKVARWLGDLVAVVERSYGHLAPQDDEINRGV